MSEKMHKLVSFARNPVILLGKPELVEPQVLFGAGTLVPFNAYIYGTKVPCFDS